MKLKNVLYIIGFLGFVPLSHFTKTPQNITAIVICMGCFVFAVGMDLKEWIQGRNKK